MATDPQTELDEFAASMRQMFLALLQQGFNEGQALVIIGQVIAAGVAAK